MISFFKRVIFLVNKVNVSLFKSIAKSIIINIKLDTSSSVLWARAIGIFTSLVVRLEKLKILAHLKSLIDFSPSVNTILLLP